VTVSGEELREALGKDRLGSNIREQLESELKSRSIGIGNPIPNEQTAKVLLFDDDEKGSMRELFGLVDRLRERRAIVEEFSLDEKRLRKAANSIRAHS
jgi:hypothetical protein